MRTALIEKLAKGGPVTVETRVKMQEYLDRWETAGGSHSDVAYLVLTHVYGAKSMHDAHHVHA